MYPREVCERWKGNGGMVYLLEDSKCAGANNLLLIFYQMLEQEGQQSVNCSEKQCQQ